LAKAVFQIDAPKDRLFGIIADFPRWSEWFPGCKEAKVVTDKGNTKQVELTLASIKTLIMGLEFDLTPLNSSTSENTAVRTSRSTPARSD
jgi:carbon monoxide dehydrogenase subunit G